MFKYIYDIFIIENKLDIIDKENVPMIQKEILNEPFLNDTIRQFFLLLILIFNLDKLKIQFLLKS